MLTVTQIAKKFSISRATVLYYERMGLLQPCTRSENGYRWYGDNAVKQLETIIAYRSYGVPVAQIHTLLKRGDNKTQEEILQDQFNHLEVEIKKLRKQQKAIVALLQQPKLLEENMVTKQRWVEIMQAAGFNEQDMQNWHRQFEKMEPEEHQKFLESLGIDPEEIKRIRRL
ncbi:MerR family transcriptional regulator [Zooshikella marina]|uniref:MerR family transcriptional regulator n=1 Tax=Zooshikella ganghwensis TaxID=202772 RepID=UPI00040F266D|nr:MerR family transcriptional regulator [Zooshikella ganghwensis]MBU2706999.1 MerR family transcriptional regulator [Zooshikella ganghwensis]